ncbi:MAG: tetratricopeptide repeat protein [Ramlibacter sp.]|nr:tetratricopeptide repeat protein [Ramlibacter sp.]
MNQSNEAAALRSQGNALLAEGRIGEATDCYARACTLAPQDALSWLNHGFGLLSLGDFDGAKTSLRRSIALDPGEADAHFLMGQIEARAGQLDAALASYSHAVESQPGMAVAALEKARTLHALTRFGEALTSIDAALVLEPDWADALHGRAKVLLELGRNEDAFASSERVLIQQPTFADALADAGTACMRMGRFDEAISFYERGLAVDSADATLHWNYGLALLTVGRFAQGWREYEWRWQATEMASTQPAFTQTHARWNGEPLIGKTILVHAEQGLGDTLQFVRFIPVLAGMAARVILQVPATLVALCARIDPRCTVIPESASPPAFDVHCPLLGLPAVLGTTIETITQPDRYLRSDPALRAQWEQRLGPREGPRVGLVWSGGTLHKNDANRSMPLATLLRGIPKGWQRVSLQREVRERDVAALKQAGVVHASDALRTFDDTAALLDCVDVVVSVDTSVAHLAGAMGKPLLLLLPHVPDWRWLVDRTDSPWYRSAQLLRQGADRAWEPLMERLHAELAARLRAGP